MPVGPYGALLDAVRGVRWPARRPVPQRAPGAHQARSRGVAPEFAEYRPYRQGDDPKRLDWKLLARSDRAFIRLAPDHAVLGTTFLVDASASMDFADKWTLAKRLVVGLAAVAHAGSDPVGLTLVSGDGQRRLEPRTRQGVVGDIARLLDGQRLTGSAALADAVATSAPRCVVITDCLGDIEALRTALARHLVKGGEAYLVHVVSGSELVPAADAVLATDPEDARVQRPLFAATRDGYRARFDEFRATVARQLRSEGVQYFEVRDDEPAESLVRRIARPAESIRG
jgi:uncharacterized protein (DUF58 family)